MFPCGRRKDYVNIDTCSLYFILVFIFVSYNVKTSLACNSVNQYNNILLET